VILRSPPGKNLPFGQEIKIRTEKQDRSALSVLFLQISIEEVCLKSGKADYLLENQLLIYSVKVNLPSVYEF
jgi:hypothetical protein